LPLSISFFPLVCNKLEIGRVDPNSSIWAAFGIQRRK